MKWQSRSLFSNHWFWLVALFILAFSIRLYHLHELMIFTYDQGRDMYVLQTISRGDIKLVGPTTGLPGVFLGPFFYYALLPGFLLSNGSPFGVVMWQMAVITPLLGLAYFILKPQVGKVWAMVATWLLVLSPGSIEEARSMWNPSWTVATILVCIFAIIRSQKQPWWLPAAALAFGLCLQTELAYAIFLAPVFGVWVLTHLPIWPGKKGFVYPWKILLASVAIFGLTLVPQLVFELKYDWQITRSLLTEMGDTTKQVSLSSVWAVRPMQMAQEIIRVTIGGSDQMMRWWLPLFLLWLWAGARLQKNAESRLLWWLFAAPLFGFMMHRGNYGNFFNYYLSPHYALTILVSVLALSQIGGKRMQLALFAAVLFTSSFLFIRYASVVFDVPRFEYTALLQIKALHSARQLRIDSNTPLEVFVPNLIPVSYQYLSEWMSRTGQTEPMAFGLSGQKNYVLISEPPFSDGSRVAFEEWYSGHHKGATCSIPQKFGITSIQVCQRP